MSDEINFRTKTLTRDKEGYYKLEKESIHQENIIIINIYILCIRATTYRKQKPT